MVAPTGRLSAFLNSSGASGAASQVVQARAANLAAPCYCDRFHVGRVHQEGALDTDFVANAAHGEGRSGPTATLANDNALKRLQASALTFSYPDLHADGVAGLKFLDVGVRFQLHQLMCFHESHPNEINLREMYMLISYMPFYRQVRTARKVLHAGVFSIRVGNQFRESP